MVKMGHTSIEESLQRSLRMLVAATVVLYLVLGGFVIITHNSADTSHKALCALRADLQTRVDSTRTFLTEHPNGFAGIPVATLNKGVADQTRTIKILDILSC